MGPGLLEMHPGSSVLVSPPVVNRSARLIEAGAVAWIAHCAMLIGVWASFVAVSFFMPSLQTGLAPIVKSLFLGAPASAAAGAFLLGAGLFPLRNAVSTPPLNPAIRAWGGAGAAALFAVGALFAIAAVLVAVFLGSQASVSPGNSAVADAGFGVWILASLVFLPGAVAISLFFHSAPLHSGPTASSWTAFLGYAVINALGVSVFAGGWLVASTGPPGLSWGIAVFLLGSNLAFLAAPLLGTIVFALLLVDARLSLGIRPTPRGPPATIARQ